MAALRKLISSRSFCKFSRSCSWTSSTSALEGIYVNKDLRLDNDQVHGFDYDYKLAHNSAYLQSLIYDLAKDHLVNELRYPESCLKFEYDHSFPIRGLYYDKLKGCLLKLDFFGSIEPDGCFFGRRKDGRGDSWKGLILRRFCTSADTTDRFNYVETIIKNFKYVEGMKVNPLTDQALTIHNLIGKPLLTRPDLPKYQESMMTEELLNEVNKNWVCLKKEDKEKKNPTQEKIESQRKFIKKRYDRYGKRQSLLNNPEEYFRAGLQLKKKFNLQTIVPMIAKKLSLRSINNYGFPIHEVKAVDFIQELATTTQCGVQLTLVETIHGKMVVEIEMKLDGRLKNKPPIKENIITNNLSEYILV